MRFLVTLSLSSMFLSSSLIAGALHLPLDLTFEESQKYYASIKKDINLRTKSVSELERGSSESIETAIAGGEKMGSWIKLINSKRSNENAVRLTSKGTQRGIPIDRPSKYGPSTVKKKLQDLYKTMPLELKNVFYGSVAIGEETLVGDKIFIKWARKVSGLYQSAVRWKGMSRWLSYYAKRKTKDVRGYYYLKGLENLDYTLSNPQTLNLEEQGKLISSLQGICINANQSASYCKRSAASSLKKGKLKEFKKKYWDFAVRNWNSFFDISDPRTDITWKQSAPGVMKVVFKDPKNPEIANWLKENVEDEFKIPSRPWTMELHYISGSFGTAHLEFKKNVTPHVSGGNKVVMDANTSLEEYGVKWTIRHEFGHILRLPDCYHEFYDEEAKLMVNYQLDTTDLMCSRAGAMNERIFNELKRVYLK